MANGEIKPLEKMFSRNHATKIFVDNKYGLSPKYGWLFHVAFDINTEVARVSNDDLLRMGFIVKSASLPKFSVDTKTLNAYNRVDIVQTKVKYDQITIKFHDDNLDVIRNFWYDYYSYYYRDADWNLNIYQASSKYNERQNQQWGYQPRQYPASSPATQQYLSAIRIYSLHNKRFAEYTFINPIITAFRHGEHSQGGEAGTLENEMVIQYQAVKYQYGQVSDDTVSGFATLQYDSRPSPMGTSPVTDGKVHDLSEGQTGLPGLINNFKNLQGGAILGSALGVAGSGLASSLLDKGFGKISALAGSASSKLSGLMSKGKVTSNGSAVGGLSTPDLSQEGLPGATDELQGQIDDVNSRIALSESALADAEADLEQSMSEAEQLQAQIDADTEQLLNPDLSSEDIAALQSYIDENTARLEEVNAHIDEVNITIDNLKSSISDDQDTLQQLYDAQNPSGNSEEDGGYGANSVTEVDPNTGETITTNPDGSQTIVAADGSIYTVPQQNPVDSESASSNQYDAYEYPEP